MNTNEKKFYELGFIDGSSHAWNKVTERAPQKDMLLLLDFDGVLDFGYYFGVSEDYPEENNHTFGNEDGFFTGEVEYWMYIPLLPDEEDDAPENIEVEE